MAFAESRIRGETIAAEDGKAPEWQFVRWISGQEEYGGRHGPFHALMPYNLPVKFVEL